MSFPSYPDVPEAADAPGIKQGRIHGRKFLQALMDAGIVPPFTQRIIIDADATNAVKVYYQCVGDVRLLSIGIQDALKDVETIRADAVQA